MRHGDFDISDRYFDKEHFETNQTSGSKVMAQIVDLLSSDDTEGSFGISNRLLCCAVRMTAIDLLIQIRSCRMRTCRQRRARMIEDRLFRFGIYLRMFRLWIFLKSVGLGIPDVQCPRVAPVSGCHCHFVFRPRLRVAGIWMMLRDCRRGCSSGDGTSGDRPTLFASAVGPAVSDISSDGCLWGFGGLFHPIVP